MRNITTYAYLFNNLLILFEQKSAYLIINSKNKMSNIFQGSSNTNNPFTRNNNSNNQGSTNIFTQSNLILI